MRDVKVGVPLLKVCLAEPSKHLKIVSSTHLYAHHSKSEKR